MRARRRRDEDGARVPRDAGRLRALPLHASCSSPLAWSQPVVGASRLAPGLQRGVCRCAGSRRRLPPGMLPIPRASTHVGCARACGGARQSMRSAAASPARARQSQRTRDAPRLHRDRTVVCSSIAARSTRRLHDHRQEYGRKPGTGSAAAHASAARSVESRWSGLGTTMRKQDKGRRHLRKRAPRLAISMEDPICGGGFLLLRLGVRAPAAPLDRRAKWLQTRCSIGDTARRGSFYGGAVYRATLHSRCCGGALARLQRPPGRVRLPSAA